MPCLPARKAHSSEGQGSPPCSVPCPPYSGAHEACIAGWVPGRLAQRPPRKYWWGLLPTAPGASYRSHCYGEVPTGRAPITRGLKPSGYTSHSGPHWLALGFHANGYTVMSLVRLSLPRQASPLPSPETPFLGRVGHYFPGRPPLAGLGLSRQWKHLPGPCEIVPISQGPPYPPQELCPWEGRDFMLALRELSLFPKGSPFAPGRLSPGLAIAGRALLPRQPCCSAEELAEERLDGIAVVRRDAGVLMALPWPA